MRSAVAIARALWELTGFAIAMSVRLVRDGFALAGGAVRAGFDVADAGGTRGGDCAAGGSPPLELETQRIFGNPLTGD